MKQFTFNFLAGVSILPWLASAFMAYAGLVNPHPDFDFNTSCELFIIFGIFPILWLVILPIRIRKSIFGGSADDASPKVCVRNAVTIFELRSNDARNADRPSRAPEKSGSSN
jgi:hypothetical protein